MKTIENKIGNQNESSDHNLECIICEDDVGVHMIAHRNVKSRICGFVISCDSCSKDLKGKKIFIEDAE